MPGFFFRNLSKNDIIPEAVVSDDARLHLRGFRAQGPIKQVALYSACFHLKSKMTFHFYRSTVSIYDLKAGQSNLTREKNIIVKESIIFV